MGKRRTGRNRTFLQVFLILLLGVLSAFACGAAQTESLPVFTVSSPEELIMAIGPDRIIRIDATALQLPDEEVPFITDYVTQIKVTDGYQLLIHDVANLTIAGAGEAPVKMLAKSRYAYILTFLNAENIKIEAVEAGHTPGDEGCIAGVFYFLNCRDIVIDRSILFGCGAEGVNLQEVDGFLFKDSVIKKCVYGIMTIKQSRNCLFINSTFADNQGWYLVDIENAGDIRFSGCRIENNIALGSDYSSIFDVSKSEAVVIEDCLVENNAAEWFVYRGTGLTVTGTPLDNNLFYQGFSYTEIYKYDEYYDNLRYLRLLQMQNEGRIRGKNRLKIKDTYTKMVNALLELERTQDAGDNELEYILGSYYAFGYQAKLLSDRRQAEECFQNILRKDPLCTPAYLALADLYYEECVTESIEDFSEDDIGLVFTNKSKREGVEFLGKALEKYLHAVQVEEEFGLEEIVPVVHYRIIALYCFTGEPGKALEYAKRLAILDPERYGKCLEIVRELTKKKRIPRKIEIIL